MQLLCSVKKNYSMLKNTLFRKTLLSFILCSIAAIAASAQTGAVHGTVLDAETEKPLVGTTVALEGTTRGTQTDALGSFSIFNVAPGRVTVSAQYLGYEVFRKEVVVRAGEVSTLRIALKTQGVRTEKVVVVARMNRESEGVLLSGQKQELIAFQSVGAAEMSRKGIGNAEAAVAQVAGVSRQEGVKNVFVRGLGDRYNATFLNGFPLPSEDPEYKNIALEFFGSDVIQNIGVSKVFGAANNGDVGGAAIDIHSKELLRDKEFSVSIDGGINSGAMKGGFLRQDGVSYFGHSRQQHPVDFNFKNSLDPRNVSLPVDHGYGFSGGKRWHLGAGRNPLSVFAVGSHSSSFAQTKEVVRNANTGDMVYQDMAGTKSSIDTRQLVLANAGYDLRGKHTFDYNFMLIHANGQYVSEYEGKSSEDYQDAFDGASGWRRRQQSNDNLLLAHQLGAQLNVAPRWHVNLGAAVNTIKGAEPDRRENNKSLQADGSWSITGSDSQRRFFSQLDETDLNAKAALIFKLRKEASFENSNITLSYRGRMVDDSFESTNYSYGSGMTAGTATNDSYTVSKDVHSVAIETAHKFGEKLAGSVGFQGDKVNMAVEHRTQKRNIDTLYWLPSLNLRYDINPKHTLRFGASKSYTLPQSKEISDYQYVDISFASQGNMKLKASDNFNADLKWDFYPSYSELLSVGVFYKHILNPIGRVDQGNSAGMLSYDNLAKFANVAGVEVELRKNILNTTTIRENMRRLSVGINASWIHSAMNLSVINTPQRQSELEGASPWLVNADLSYNYSTEKHVLNLSLVAGWYSNRIYTLGTQGYNDIIEESAMNLSLVSSLKIGTHWNVKFSAANLLDPPHRLTRQKTLSPGKIVLSELRKGIDLSMGVTYTL